MASIVIEQATYFRCGEAPPQPMASSPGFLDDWRAEVELILREFGSRPPGWSCPSAVFAQPLGSRHVIIVHVADLQPDSTALDSPVGFHVLVFPREVYRNFAAEPFSIAERLEPDWNARDIVPALSWSMEAPARRTVEEVRAVLQRVKGKPLQEDVPIEEQEFDPAENSESPALLGGVQVLVDGGRLMFERPAPDTDLLKALWTLLPNSTRTEIWPASFAFSNKLQFDVAVAPRFDPAEYDGYTTEEQAADYPEGRYELNLQIAAESGNQHDLDHLFERRSWNDTWRLGITLLVAVIILTVASRFLAHRGEIPEPPPDPDVVKVHQKQAQNIAAVAAMNRPLETALLLHATFPPSPRSLEVQIAASVAAMNDPLAAVTQLPAAREAWNEMKSIRAIRETMSYSEFQK